MWIGSAVHSSIEGILKEYRAERKTAGIEDLERKLLQRLRYEFQLSRSGQWGQLKWRLYEHEYESDVSDEEWKSVAHQALSCLRVFWSSQVHEQIKAFSTDQFLEIEDFSHFYLDDVKVHVVLDLGFRDKNKIVIYDWKTGRAEGELHALQLACYRIYAQGKWGVREADVETIEFNLARNETKKYHDGGLSSEEGILQMRESIRLMQEQLIDKQQNLAEEERFPLVENEKACTFCNFKKVCPRWAIENI